MTKSKILLAAATATTTGPTFAESTDESLQGTMQNGHVVELVKWRSKAATSDADMQSAVEGILPDLETLPGFVSQVLYKDDHGNWVDLYVWETRDQAVASNDLMAPKKSFSRLMALIEASSVSIEFLKLP